MLSSDSLANSSVSLEKSQQVARSIKRTSKLDEIIACQLCIDSINRRQKLVRQLY